MLIKSRLWVFASLLLLFGFIVPKFAICQDIQLRLQIPKAIVAEAKRRFIPLTAVRLTGKQWIACIESPSQGELCILLGEDVGAPNINADVNHSTPVGTRSVRLNYGDQILIEQYGRLSREISVVPGSNLAASVAEYGTLIQETSDSLRLECQSNCEARISVTGRSGERSINALPRFRRESPRLVRTTDLAMVSEYMSHRPNESYLVIVTVPSRCEPCRRMDQVIRRYHESEQLGGEKIKTFILEYFSFTEAEVILGRDAVFPTTIVFPKKSETARSSLPSLAIGFPQVNGVEAISKQFGNVFKRPLPSGISRGTLTSESLDAMIRTATANR